MSRTELMIIQDGLQMPSVFHWNGAIPEPRLRRWIHSNGLEGSCPDDLIHLWLVTGGGDYFESGTILGPFGDPVLGDDVVGANEQLSERGLPAGLMMFATGAVVAAVDQSTLEYVVLDHETLEERSRYRSLDDWYEYSIRAELGAQYGLR